MRDAALIQSTPDRHRWSVEGLAQSIFPSTTTARARARARADAKAQIRRACVRLVADKLIEQAPGNDWRLPPETKEEARAREEYQKKIAMPPPPGRQIDPANRKRLVKLLGMLGSKHDGEVLSAAQHVERLRRKGGFSWDDLLR